MTPAEIAARLTPARRRALLWLPGDGSAQSTVYANHTYGLWSYQLAQACRRMVQLGLVHRTAASSTTPRIMWNLTPLGLAVRAVLETEQSDG